jgi:hypothetical protein
MSSVIVNCILLLLGDSGSSSSLQAKNKIAAVRKTESVMVSFCFMVGNFYYFFSFTPLPVRISPN